jgi:hypothetical protein
MVSSRMLRRVALVRTNVSEELSASFFRVTRIGAVGTMLAVTSNRRTLRGNTKSKSVSHPDKTRGKITVKSMLLMYGITFRLSLEEH